MFSETQKEDYKRDHSTVKALKPDFLKQLEDLSAKDRRIAFHYWKGVQGERLEELGRRGNINLQKHELDHKNFMEVLGFVDKIVSRILVKKEEKNSNYYEAEIFIEEYNKERQKTLEARSMTPESLTKEAVK